MTTLALRQATLDDLTAVLPRTRALNDHEEIAVTDAHLERALRALLEDPTIGRAWLIETAGAPIGYALVTFSYDLEFAGREGWITELWIDPVHRGGGLGRQALELIAGEATKLGVRALHLQVRPDNPAKRLYERSGFVANPRVVMTRRLVD